MTKIKLLNGVIINAKTVEIVQDVLEITTDEMTVEALARLFSDESNTKEIKLMTVSGKESGLQTGFTHFEGIMYNADDSKTVHLLRSKQQKRN